MSISHSIRRLIASLLLITAQSTHADSFVGRYGPTRSTQLAELQDALRQSRTLEQMASALSKGVVLPEQLTLGTTECGSANAFYTAQHKAIVLCLDLVQHLVSGITKDYARIATRAEIDQTISGALGFILLHELGHALIDQLKLPVLGREEDAADQIGLFFVLYGEAAPQSLAGAMWFFKQNTLFYTRSHFADEHSLGPQRQTNLACWAYGSDPQRFSVPLA